MMAWFEQFLVKYPELAVFLAISIGYWIGGVKLKGFSLGPVTGSLFAGILIAPSVNKTGSCFQRPQTI